MRCLVFPQVFQGGQTWFFGTDPYYHMRRIFLAIEHFPHLPYFDSYMNFPSGALIKWPAGFDVLMASLALALGPENPPPEFVERLCAAAIPVMGMLTVMVFYFIARSFLPWKSALFAALLLALSAPHILVSRLGRVDHHVMEVLLPALGFLAWFRALESSRPGLRTALYILAGTALGLSLTVWTGSVMFLGIFILYIFFCLLAGIHNKAQPAGLMGGAQWVLFSAAITLVPLGAVTPWGREGKILYLALSWFQPLVPLYAWMMLTALRVSLPAFAGRSWRVPAAAAVLFFTGGLLTALTGLVQPEFMQTLADAGAYLFTRETQVHTVAEAASLFAVKPAVREMLYGRLLWLLPATGLYALLRLRRPGPARGPAQALLFFWFSITGILSLLQIRFSPAFALPLCLYWALMLKDLGDLLGRAGRRRGRAGLYRTIAVPGYLALAAAAFQTSLAQPSQAIYPALLSTFSRIKDITPETSHFLNPDQKPEYGILSHWPYGHYLAYLSRRPNIANPFGQAEWYLKGVRSSYRFLLAESEADAVEICDRVQARYVLAAPLSGHLSGLATHLALLRPESIPAADAPEYIRAHYRCFMNSRLLLRDGRTAEPAGECASPGPLKHFRLLYESELPVVDKVTGAETSFFKLFERVRGAAVSGRARPGTAVDLEADITCPSGRSFHYQQSLTADSQGRFSTRAPYPTDDLSSPCRSRSPYRIRSGDSIKTLEISQEAVLAGGRVEVDLILP